MITLIFGDSITQGLWDEKGGWADRLKAYVQTEEVKNKIANYHEVINLGVDGNFTRQVLARFENETQARYFPEEKYIFIFAIGINDTLHRDNTDFESTPEKYKLELQELILKARKYSQNLIFLDLTPVNETQTNPLNQSSTGKCYTNERIDKFNGVLHETCTKNNCSCIEINKLFKQNGSKNLLIDGLHPNTNGHELIFGAVLPELKKILAL
jgi:lysophospholipase L1-like esterase